MRVGGINIGLRTQLMSLFLIFSVIPAALATGLGAITVFGQINTAQQNLVSATNEKLNSIGMLSAENILGWAEDRFIDVKQLMGDPRIRSFFDDLTTNETANGLIISDLELFFSEVLKAYDGIFWEINLLNLTGDIVAQSTVPGTSFVPTVGNLASDVLFTGATQVAGDTIKSDQVYLKSIYRGGYYNETYMASLSGVIRSLSGGDSGNITNILVLFLRLEYLWDTIAPVDDEGSIIEEQYIDRGLGMTGEVYIISKTSTLAISRSRFEIYSAFILEKSFTNNPAFNIASERGMVTGSNLNYQNIPVLGFYMYIGESLENDQRPMWVLNASQLTLPWIVVVEISAEEALAPVNQLWSQVILWSILSIGVIACGTFIVILISILVSRLLTNPLVSLAESSKKISRGDLTTDIKVVQEGDEVADLAMAFLEMVGFLQPTLTDLQQVSGRLAAMSEQLSGSTREVNTSSQEIAVTTQEIADGTARQSERLSKASILVEEMTTVVDATLRDIERTSEVIFEVADQTNILALNAAIEAARAGDYGRGFGVVADNVRRLSEEARIASDSIESMLKSIRKQMKTSVDAISHAVQDTAAISEETAAGAQEVSAATEEQSSIIEEMTSSVQVLAGMADMLRALTQGFILPSDTTSEGELKS